MNKKNEKSFEDALQRLEEIAQLLENESTPLLPARQASTALLKL